MRRHFLTGAALLLVTPTVSFAQAQPGTGRPTTVDPAALHNGIRTSKVVGSSVYNEAKDDIGKVDDIIIPRGGGAPVAVISVGGFLGIGNRYVAVPLNELQFQNNRWTLARATKEYLKTLPPFSYDETTPRR